MRALRTAALAVTVIAMCLQAQTTWRTTRNGSQTGECRLSASKVTMTIHPFAVDIEEEAVIATDGAVTWGDPATLEIMGSFTLTPGSAVRSLILWNGNTILKAKLKERAAADIAYENVVNRQVVRDPIVLRNNGGNQYSFQVFPVAAGSSRRMRILYTVPLCATPAGPTFSVQLAFVPGPRTTPSQIPVDFRNATGDSVRYILEHNNQYSVTRKVLQFDATYRLPSEAFVIQSPYYWERASATALSIRPDTSRWTKAYTTTAETTGKTGIYTAVYAAMPPSVAEAIAQMDRYSLETSITVGGKTFLSDAPSEGCFAIYCKSQSAWNGVVRWTAYAGDGSIGYTYDQRIEPQVIAETSSLLPLVWAAKYTIKEGLGSLGGLYGFVDRAMSLLALEADSIPSAQAAQWSDSGVPRLEQRDIVFSTATQPAAPQENLIYEFTSVTPAQSDATDVGLKLQVTAKGMLMIRLASGVNGVARVAFYNLAGRMVEQWRDVHLSAGTAGISVPGGLHGTLVVHVSVGGTTVKQKVILP